MDTLGRKKVIIYESLYSKLNFYKDIMYHVLQKNKKQLIKKNNSGYENMGSKFTA